MTSAQDVLRVAASQIGYHEAPNGANKFGAFYGMDKVAWCAEFQYWCFAQAGGAGLIPKTAYTPTFYQWFADRGQASHSPQVGDLVFYNWPGDGVNRIQHVGIVEKVINASTIQTIEGNTTQGAGNQSDGGFVARRTRSTSAVVGYGRPVYSGTSPTPIPVPAFDPNSLVTLQKGMMNNPHVANFQKASNAYPWSPELPLLPVTGNYLDQTTVVVKKAQAQCGVTGSDANGEIIGPRTKMAFASLGIRW